MGHTWRFLFWLAVVIIAIDWYTFQGIRALVKKLPPKWKMILFSSFWSITLLTFLVVLLAAFTQVHDWHVSFRTYLPASLFILYFSKLFLILFLLIDDFRRGIQWMFLAIRNLSASPVTSGDQDRKDTSNKISRSQFMSRMGVIVAGTPFVSMMYGMIENAYNYQIRRHTIRLPNLPDTFHGMKIIQISDIHSGSFTKTEPLAQAVKMINREKADLIFFTGDLVNDRASEIEEYITIFKNLEAAKGIFSTFGNHDYGDYVQWDSDKHQAENLEQLAYHHRQLGWKLLRNEHAIIEKEKQQIALLGVENWSAFQRFKRHGDLEKAYQGTENIPVKLLLSHDPSHWDAEVTTRYRDINIMFAGHTHGMQFGIEIPGFRWSPVQYLYKQWADLSRKDDQYLYVNRGFGFIGYPGRVGILPEITVFTIEKA